MEPSTLVIVAIVAVVVVAVLLVARRPKRSSHQQRKALALATPLPAGTLARVARPAFLPVCEQRDTPGPVSKFCGRPWLPEGLPWPACKLCKRPMQLFLQLDLDALPEGGPPSRGGGLLQLFYCTNTEDECEQDEGWSGESTSMKLARIVDPAGPGSTPAEDVSYDPQPAHTITGWERADDYPDSQDLELFFPEIPDDLRERIAGDEASFAVTGDKLGGWPEWVQGNEWYDCPACGAQMELLFQIVSEDHVGWMFGDVGIAHLLRCAEHPEQMTFGWACH